MIEETVPSPLNKTVLSASSAAMASLTDTKGAFLKIIGEVEEYAIILLERDGTVATWNKGAQQIKGYTPAEIIGKNFRLFYPTEDKEANFPETLLEAAVRDGKVNHEGWRVRKNGSRFWGSVTITAIHGEEHEVMGFLKVTRDLTERRIAEDHLNNYIEEIRIKNEALQHSEERYHKMVAEVRDYSIILLDQEGSVLDWNLGAERMKGYSSEEILSKTFRLFYTKEDRDAGLPEKLLKEAKTKGAVVHEGWRVRKSGERFWALVTITALHDDNNEVFGYAKVTRDLSDQKIAEEKLSNYVEELRQTNDQLRRSEERYYRMIEEVQDYAIIFLSLDGQVQNWNSGAEKIKGYSRHEIIGKNFRVFYTPEDLERGLPDQLLSQAIEKGKVVNEGYRVRQNGSRFWASVVMTALHDADNNIVGFSKVTRDLTERKLTEEALDQKNRDLEYANAQLSSFAFVASHDLKEPLRKVQIFASRIAETESLNEKNADYIGKIRLSANRMQRLIENLLSFAKLATPGEPEDVDLNQVIREVRNDLEIAITEKHATLNFEELPTLHGTSFQFHQLFLNLVSNSLKFSKSDESPVIVVSHSIVKGPVPEHHVLLPRDYHRIVITDNGIGFSQDQADRIFDVFYRLHSRETFEGTGIGLAIVKKVVDNHHGYIATEGRLGAGASFFIYFPTED